MKYEELLILLPCHSLEDFPLYHEGDEAAGLLAHWSAMWHPALIASAGKTPTWQRIDDPPEELANRLIMVPAVSAAELPTGFAQRAKTEGGVLIRKKVDRKEIVDLALAELDGGDAGVDPELTADFFALGYCYLQVELLTRQMRYSSNLDEIYFRNQATAAAVAAVAGDATEAREKLEACFNVLAEERDHYYPVDAFIIDLTLVADTTIGESLRQDLSGTVPRNLLLGGQALEKIVASEPATLEALRAGLENGSVCLVGGEGVERRLPLLSFESILAEIRRGSALYENALGHRPKIYGRRRFGLMPGLPQVLTQAGFQGAMHATLDEGNFPEGSQIKTTWEGTDGTVIDAIARAPVDAAKPETYLKFAVKMGESMDMDHVATVCLAHWPGQTTPWLEDLRRIARYCNALGKFVTLEEYFRDTALPGHPERFEAKAYRSPYLKQAVIRRHADPISSSVRYWKRRAQLEAAESLNTLAALITDQPIQLDTDLAFAVDQAAELPPVPRQEEALANAAAGGSSESQTPAAEAAAKEAAVPAIDPLDVQTTAAVDEAARRFAAALPRKTGAKRGLLVVNPSSFVRRMGVVTTGLEQPPAIARPVYAADAFEGKTHLVVDTPAMGFAWLESADAPPRKSKTIPLAEEGVLRNEFFQALINMETGALQSLHQYNSRSNRMSQQLGFRLPGRRPQPGEAYSDPDEGAQYARMQAESVRTTIDSEALGEITVAGKLVGPDRQVYADFQQRYQVFKGSRVLRIEIELDPHVEPKADPWNSYFCARFAWRDESSEIWRTAHQTRQPHSGKRIESPHYVSVEEEKIRTTILTGGLPFHRRIGHRMMDTLLVVRGETARKFTIGIGVDLTHPMNDAMGLILPPVVVEETAGPPAPNPSSWLFHFDARNVTATHWSPLTEDGKIVGFCVRLLETSGRSVKTSLSTFRSVATAKKVDFQGLPGGECSVEDGKIRIDLAAHQWIEVQARWG
ncbi:hypothetical protein [Lignipirellula cremea]|uniref:Glycoside hydrolase family 38 N-terminal domain-containing protein n=1 Tax=Lignipirellula cremea TaxID=2528010 RepID=A0A518DSC9_9BACT|nr:hypothetical protein [Lignipirellula cremea]QDU94743.1 hypothetical protein Pla8534_25490 [Lignipirellula cremea]